MDMLWVLTNTHAMTVFIDSMYVCTNTELSSYCCCKYSAIITCHCQFLWMCEAWRAMGDLGQAKVCHQLRRKRDPSNKKNK